MAERQAETRPVQGQLGKSGETLAINQAQGGVRGHGWTLKTGETVELHLDVGLADTFR